MECLSPYRIDQRTKTQRDAEALHVACGRCMPCRINKAQDWTFRLEIEARFSRTAHFLTLTYDDESITRNDLGHTILVKKDLQNFIRKLRYEQKKLSKDPIRYYAVGEYGGESYRAHYHLIIFNIDSKLLTQIREIWNKGHIKIEAVNRTTIQYVCKYITKFDTRNLAEKELPVPFNLMSLKPPIGHQYYENEVAKKYHSQSGKRNFVIRGGKRVLLPRHIREKIHLTSRDSELAKFEMQVYSRQKKKEQEMIDKILRKAGDNPLLIKNKRIEHALKKEETRVRRRNKI